MKTEDAEIKERIELAKQATKVSEYSDKKTLEQYLKEEFGDSNVSEKDGKYVVKANEKEYIVDNN